jgi:hypothetical protein
MSGKDSLHQIGILDPLFQQLFSMLDVLSHERSSGQAGPQLQQQFQITSFAAEVQLLVNVASVFRQWFSKHAFLFGVGFEEI